MFWQCFGWHLVKFKQNRPTLKSSCFRWKYYFFFWFCFSFFSLCQRWMWPVVSHSQVLKRHLANHPTHKVSSCECDISLACRNVQCQNALCTQPPYQKGLGTKSTITLVMTFTRWLKICSLLIEICKLRLLTTTFSASSCSATTRK